MKNFRESLASLVMLGVSISVFGQMPDDNREILLAMATNAKRVVQYEWKQRVTV